MLNNRVANGLRNETKLLCVLFKIVILCGISEKH